MIPCSVDSVFARWACEKLPIPEPCVTNNLGEGTSNKNVIMDIIYQTEPDLEAAEFIDLLRRSTLAERRPVDDAHRIETMLRNADVIVTARSGNLLTGVSRAISDFVYCTYLSDLAVDERFQKQGIGRRLLRLTHEAAGLQTRLILLSAPLAESYYPHVGLTQHTSCWMLEPEC